MSDKEPLNRNPVIASGRECRLKDSSDGIFRKGCDALEKTAFQAGILFARQRGGIGRAGERTEAAVLCRLKVCLYACL
ncbi:hypothetical protein [Neisseria polysaccharea]|uniref:hypothetical protein n=1 Tax=Neisseria polysaccharea TaxID=489 RepID=UPI00272DAB06|nr:hypothetical protein [Neisseria polysaccharea]